MFVSLQKQNKHMKLLNKIILASVAVTLMSCESKQDVANDIEKLRMDRTSLQNEVYLLREDVEIQEAEVRNLEKKLNELHIYESGKTPKYILKLKLKQSRVSLDITKHIKDGMNAIEFELPVDKSFYESVGTGTEIVDNFRTGSFVLYGSFGSWKMTVVDKEIR